MAIPPQPRFQTMTEPTVTRHAEDGVLTLTINRPEKLNALDASVVHDLEAAFEAAAGDETVRVVVLTGAGDRAFVAGADIGELQALGADEAKAFLRRGHALMNRIENLGKPVIAAINGFALGGGCELAMACTIRLAADSAMLGLPEVKLGLLPGYGGTQRLARLVGRGRALHLMLTGDPISAKEALALGVVTEVVEASDLSEAAGKLAGKLARGAPLAQQLIIDVVNRGADLPMSEGLELEIDAFAEVTQTQDMKEGTEAFLEKRRAVFKGV